MTPFAGLVLPRGDGHRVIVPVVLTKNGAPDHFAEPNGSVHRPHRWTEHVRLPERRCTHVALAPTGGPTRSDLVGA